MTKNLRASEFKESEDFMLTNYQNKILTVILLTGFLLAPLEILHAIGWVFFHIYELLEFVLDELIHRLFHTSRHTTQVIVFYLIIAIAIYGVYRIAKVLQSFFRQEQIVFLINEFKHKKILADFVSLVLWNKKTKCFFGLGLGVVFLTMAFF
jgi:ABC-type nickel/cobalt efflux system permease component RcnA